jgi:site-specific recombinase XerD
MSDDLVRIGPRVGLAKETRSWAVPALVADSGPDASRRFLEFFAATIRNPNTRAAYARALSQFFAWCEDRGIRALDQIEPMVVAAYIEQHPGSAPTVKQHLAAIRMCFDWLVTGQILRQNPATSVKGPKYIVTRGKTPVLAADEARQLLDSIETDTIVALRDRALIGLMVYSFARVGAAVGMSVEDYKRKRWWFRLHEKGGKHHAVPAHHNAEEYMDAYLGAARIAGARGTPLFRTVNRARELTDHGMSRIDAFRMIKRRAKAAGLPPEICCHTFRATGSRPT